VNSPNGAVTKTWSGSSQDARNRAGREAQISYCGDKRFIWDGTSVWRLGLTNM
jgi:hypothetical protein